MNIKNFKRVATFLIGGSRELNFPEFTLGFDLVFDNTPTPNSCEATITNPSDATVQALESQGGKKVRMQISGGYERDVGQVISGEVESFVPKRNGVDRQLKIQIIDRIEKWATARVSRTFAGKVSLSKMAQDLLDTFGLVGDLNLGTDRILEDKSFNTKLRVALVDIAKESDSEFFMRDGRIIFRPKENPGVRTVFELSPTSGLVGRPERQSDGTVRAVSIFNFRIGSGDGIKLKSEEFDSVFSVVKGRHKFNDRDGLTEMLLKAVA